MDIRASSSSIIPIDIASTITVAGLVSTRQCTVLAETGAACEECNETLGASWNSRSVRPRSTIKTLWYGSERGDIRKASPCMLSAIAIPSGGTSMDTGSERPSISDRIRMPAMRTLCC